jgi:hypothetical protein
MVAIKIKNETHHNWLVNKLLLHSIYVFLVFLRNLHLLMLEIGKILLNIKHVTDHNEHVCNT